MDRDQHRLAGHDGVGLRVSTLHIAEIRHVFQRHQVDAGLEALIRLGVHGMSRSGDPATESW
jgi:hypothetical protein